MRLNEVSKNGSWLILSYLSNLDGMGGNAQAQWIDDRLIWFEREGIKVYLLSSPCGARHKEFYHIRVPSIAPSGVKLEISFIHQRKGLRGFWVKFFETLIFLPIYPLFFLERAILRIGRESQGGWFPTAAIAGYFICLKKKPSIIYSTGGPASAHIAAAIVSKLTGIPWIAEFQDPLVHPCVGKNRFSKGLLDYIEKMVFSMAAKVIFCTKKAAKSAAERHGFGKVNVIYPGAPIEKIPSNNNYVKGECCKFAHFGSLYQSRNLNFFLKALEKVFLERPELTGHFTLELYGGIYTEDIRKQIENFPYKQLIKVHGFVKRDEALINAVKSDVLLLIQNTDLRSSESIPTKVYEYLHMRKPILGLVYHNEELESMLKSHGHYIVSADNVEEIKNAIILYLYGWQKGELNNNHFLPCGLTVERATSQLIDLAASIR